MNYKDIHSLRLNRYGNDYNARIQGKREKEFQDMLLKSPYRIDFEYNGSLNAGCLERYKQDETQTFQYLLTSRALTMPAGTILEIKDYNEQIIHYMIYFLEDIQASGYNKYILLKMTHFLEWVNKKGELCQSWAYLIGPGRAAFRPTLQSGKNKIIYSENNSNYSFILPYNENISIDMRFKTAKGAYSVVSYDIESTDGVQYVTIDPIYEYDESIPPEKTTQDTNEEFYWFEGGNE